MSDQDQPVTTSASVAGRVAGQDVGREAAREVGRGTAGYGASDITVLKGLEAVRKRPGMYIGSTGERGLHHLVYEVVDNAVDEALAGFCDHIEVTVLADGGLRVVDNGRGIPVDEHPTEHKPTVEVVMTILHAGGKFGGGGYAVSGGLHGVGVSVVNALSTRVNTEVRRQGHVWRMSFADGGRPTTSLIKGEETTETGTTQVFYPDPAVFETVDFDYETLRRRFQQMAFLNKGLRITLTDERELPEAGDEIAGSDQPTTDIAQGASGRSVSYYYEHGLRDYVAFLNKSKKVELVHPEIIDFEAEQQLDPTHGISLEIAMQWTSAYSESVHTYANTINTTEGGTHEEGFRTALTTLVNKYAREKGLLKDRDDNLTGDDIREGLTAVISVKLSEPQFEGQTKTKLGNTEARTFVQQTVYAQLGDWLDSHPSDPEHQAIMPIRGKILNVEKARLDRALSSDTIRSLITAFGTGIGEDFDLTKLRYGKIVIMADADVDGQHIATLLLTLLFRYMRPLIEQGHTYIAMPPLYRLKWTNADHEFAYSDLERDQMLKAGAEAGHRLPKDGGIQRYKGLGEMNDHELWETTMDPTHRILKQVTLDEAADADETFSILMGDDVEQRRSFIQRNAADVRFLDI